MKIETVIENNELSVALEGRLDTVTSPELEAELKKSLDTVTALTFDFEKLAYISSAGLRILLGCQKKMNAAGGKMLIKNVSDDVREIFEITGMSDIFTVQ